MNLRTKKMTYTALLVAYTMVAALVMPKITIPPFSATLTLHVPLMLAMLMGPASAALVGIGSAIGFMALSPVIAARAVMHIVVGVVGAYVIKKGWRFEIALLVTAPIHGLLESLIVLPFGYSLYTAFIVTGIGTIIHHCMDGFIAIVVYRSIRIVVKDGIFSKA